MKPGRGWTGLRVDRAGHGAGPGMEPGRAWSRAGHGAGPGMEPGRAWTGLSMEPGAGAARSLGLAAFVLLGFLVHGRVSPNSSLNVIHCLLKNKQPNVSSPFLVARKLELVGLE
jgi:hypothetical protein